MERCPEEARALGARAAPVRGEAGLTSAGEAHAARAAASGTGT